jgi:hypothetical protein
MTASLSPTLSVVGTDEPPAALAGGVPSRTSPAVWHLVEGVGVTVEEMLAAVGGQTGIRPSTSPDGASRSAPPLRPPANTGPVDSLFRILSLAPLTFVSGRPDRKPTSGRGGGAR